MGFLDDLSSTINRGAEATARTAQSLKLKAQIADLNSQRNNVCSRLGAAVYDRLKDDQNFRSGLEEIFESIDDCDRRIASLKEEVEKLEAEAARAKSQWMDSCPCCGYKISQGDSFCCRCGTKIPKRKPATDEADASVDVNGSTATEDIPVSNAPIDVEPIIDVAAEPIRQSEDAGSASSVCEAEAVDCDVPSATEYDLSNSAEHAAPSPVEPGASSFIESPQA